MCVILNVTNIFALSALLDVATVVFYQIHTMPTRFFRFKSVTSPCSEQT